MVIKQISEKKGLGVKTLIDIEKFTIICEYIGDVFLTSEIEKRSELSKSNSRMVLAKNKDPSKTLEIIPFKHANIAKYINHAFDK